MLRKRTCQFDQERIENEQLLEALSHANAEIQILKANASGKPKSGVANKIVLTILCLLIAALSFVLYDTLTESGIIANLLSNE